MIHSSPTIRLLGGSPRSHGPNSHVGATGPSHLGTGDRCRSQPARHGECQIAISAHRCRLLLKCRHGNWNVVNQQSSTIGVAMGVSGELSSDAGLLRAVISNTCNYLHDLEARRNMPKYVPNGSITGEDRGAGILQLRLSICPEQSGPSENATPTVARRLSTIQECLALPFKLQPPKMLLQIELQTLPYSSRSLIQVVIR